ncbi:hypothetical protein EI94DRAFT_147635 [Lactarius quietus]|nr:hypothetical protein EI94DRAFT_147635 [Lactarius quietus]
MSEPTQPPLQGPQGDAMDVDPPPSHLPSPSSAPEGLPFPGKLVGGVHEVEHQDIGKLRFVDLRDLCGNYGLPKTGNKAALTERLTTFSADRKAWDGLVPSAHNKHRGPRDGGVAKDAKKKGSTKQSTLRRELLFGDTADGTGSTTGPCLPAEWSKDPRTDEERRDLLAWVRPRPSIFVPLCPSRPHRRAPPFCLPTGRSLR